MVRHDRFITISGYKGNKNNVLKRTKQNKASHAFGMSNKIHITGG